MKISLSLSIFVALALYPCLLSAQKTAGTIPEQAPLPAWQDAIHPVTDPARSFLSADSSFEWTAMPYLDSYMLVFDQGKTSAEAPDSRYFSFQFDEPGYSRSFALGELRLSGQGYIAFRDGNGRLLAGYTAADLRGKKNLLGQWLNPTKVVLEWHEPQPAYRSHPLSVRKIYYKQNQGTRDRGFGESYECHINSACPQGDPYRDETNGTCRVTMILEEGIGACSGSLINNLRQDGTPYILSAFHCQDGYTPIYDLWTFDFFYRAAGCDNPVSEPQAMTFTGCTAIAGRMESDFLLLRLQDTIPASAGLYFNAWNATMDSLPVRSTMIHHPSGDIQKISLDHDAPVVVNSVINWGNGKITPPRHHLRTFWDEGTSQGGSSGAPLFNAAGEIVAQLHGGSANCTSVFRSNFGRMAFSWNSGSEAGSRLTDWLDPDQTGALNCPGMYLQQSQQSYSVRLTVLTSDSVPMPGLFTEMQLPDHITLTYEEGGVYTWSGFESGEDFSVRVFRDDAPANGVTTTDLIMIQRHILGIEPFTDPYILIAADVNRSGSITAADLADIRKVLLGKAPGFPNNESWRFVPKNTYQVRIENEDIDLGTSFGIKIGDVNNTRQPGR